MGWRVPEKNRRCSDDWTILPQEKVDQLEGLLREAKDNLTYDNDYFRRNVKDDLYDLYERDPRGEYIPQIDKFLEEYDYVYGNTLTKINNLFAELLLSQPNVLMVIHISREVSSNIYSVYWTLAKLGEYLEKIPLSANSSLVRICDKATEINLKYADSFYEDDEYYNFEKCVFDIEVDFTSHLRSSSR